ncbi:hypothetical protein TREAZ_0873 [Leadbettera azotonutricia ZAS-9]|uniref:Uncharacterized protein n=1 Tax=Leadbettera azotonutricia (strain ATCC BAA-888 / DSM 13862 / ZAS-9) TaxID=545695 RepID=F5Y909_LEAAZ|nr:hypothetical protein TREAZ_0873 [Leadbettera azotonutricia ZAS-9]
MLLQKTASSAWAIQAYYIIYGVIEILITVFIVITAIKWPKK